MKIVIIILTCFLLVPFTLSAQDEPATPNPLWELSQVVISEQLGIEFNAPQGWRMFKDEVHFVVYVVQNATDFRAISDRDSLTVPDNPIIVLRASPIEAEEQALSLEELAALWLERTGNTNEETHNITLLARSAISMVIMRESSQRSGVVALWRQGDTLFVFALTVVGTEIDGNLMATWGLLLDGIRPTGALELTETAEVAFLAYSIDYPTQWNIRVEQRGSFNSLNISQFSDEETPGYRIIIWTTLMADDEDDSPLQIAERLAGVFNVTHDDQVPIDEFFILGQRGFGMGWSSNTGETTYGILVPHTPFDELETYYIVIAPTQARLDDFWGTWIAMLQSVSLLE